MSPSTSVAKSGRKRLKQIEPSSASPALSASSDKQAGCLLFGVRMINKISIQFYLRILFCQIFMGRQAPILKDDESAEFR